MKKRYHFIAIGGIGMSGLAKYLIEKGFEVSGSDVCRSKYTDKIAQLGARVFIGHADENLPDDCVVVASTAIKEDNPELVKARRLGLTVLHRSDLLAEISRDEKFFIGYSGTHGKTTTSGMAAYVLAKAGLNPSYVVGGMVPEFNTNAKFDSDKIFVAELDESDGTVVKYAPNVTVINNLEADHIDFYTDGLKSLQATFEILLQGLTKGAKVLINNDCIGTKCFEGENITTFGLDDSADYVAKNISQDADYTSFNIFHKDEFVCDLKIILHGKHNVYNALAVFASLMEAGIDVVSFKEHFSTFSGMGRRFQYVGEVEGAKLYDDYAHHPTEIKATLSSLEAFKGKNIIAVFQPHRYTRLKSLWDDFLGAFDCVNKVIVTDVFAASEDVIDGITSKAFTEALLTRVPAEYLSGSIEDVAKKMFPLLKPNDVVIGLGAGTITALGKDLLKLGEETAKRGN